MPRGDRYYTEHWVPVDGSSTDGPKTSEASRFHRGGRSRGGSPSNVPTPTRGGRYSDKREKNSTALGDLMRKKGVDEAWNSLEEMQQQGVNTDKYTVSRMLMKTVGDGRGRLNTSRIYRGIGLVEKFIEMQPEDVDEVLLNALLDTCCRMKDLTRLEAIMQRMRDLKITPSPVTLGILVKTYGQAGDIEKVLQVWDEMEPQRGQANAVTFGCMIDACVKCSRLDKAVEIFKGMRESGKHRNTILYTTLIKGYGLEKDLASALELFREMPRERVPYNTITYNSIIDACVKGGDLRTAEILLREITAPGSNLEPDLITFSTLLKGYCQAGALDQALQLVEVIKARGLRCDELVYNTLMDGCVKANDVTAGVGLFEEMVHNGMKPSSITHSILARLYQTAGYQEDAMEAVAQLYMHHGIELPAVAERGRGAFRKGHHRSPHSSPTASPMSGYGMRSDAYWNGWCEPGYEAFMNPSSASTPCGSPMSHHGHTAQGAGIMFPTDAFQSIPPLPGMGGPPLDGSQTPMTYGSSCAGGTPMGSGYGSYAGSPTMSPMGMDQQAQGGMVMAVPGGQMQIVSTSTGTAMPSLPPWPYGGESVPAAALSGFGMATAPLGATSASVSAQGPLLQSTDAPMLQCLQQGGLPSMPSPMANMMNASTVGGGDTPHPNASVGGSPTSFGNCPPAAHWQQPVGSQPTAFSMPSQSDQQAFFQVMPGGQMGGDSANPFGL